MINTVLTAILVAANIFFMYFYFNQLRQQKRGLIHTKYVSHNKEGDEKQSSLEISPFYFFIENNSQNTIKNLKVEVKSKLEFEDNLKINKKFKTLKIKYINPHERIKSYLFRLGGLSNEFSNLFSSYTNKDGKSSFICPKKDLKIKLFLKLTWGSFPKYKQYDYYEITWESPRHEYDVEHHPRIFSYNKRNGFVVEKLK